MSPNLGQEVSRKMIADACSVAIASESQDFGQAPHQGGSLASPDRTALDRQQVALREKQRTFIMEFLSASPDLFGRASARLRLV